MNQINKGCYDDLELLPERLTGWGSYDKFFEKILLQVNPKTIVEVGSWLGASAINMAKLCKQHELQCDSIICIDTWLGAAEFWTMMSHTPERDLKCKNGYPSVYYQFLSNVVHHDAQDLIQPIPNTSVVGFEILKYKRIRPDLVYIDGSHLEDDVYLDIKNYRTIINPGGVLFGDDRTLGSVANALGRARQDFALDIQGEGRFWYATIESPESPTAAT